MVRVKLVTKYPISYAIDREKIEVTADGRSGYVNLTAKADIASDKFVIETESVEVSKEIVFGKKIPTNGLVLEYPIFEGSGTTLYDTSGNNNNGDIYGAIWKQLPTGKYVLSFDGKDDYVKAPYLSVFNRHPFTVTAWFKVNKLGDNAILICGDSASKDRWLQCVIAGSRIRFGFYDDDLDSDDVVNAGKWYHVAFVWEGPETRKRYIYLNAEVVAEDVSQGDLRVESGSATEYSSLIGISLAKVYFWGDIGLLRIYGRDLTAREVEKLFEIERALYGV